MVWHGLRTEGGTVRITISGPPKSGRTTLVKHLDAMLSCLDYDVALRDDNGGLDRPAAGDVGVVELHTVHRPSEAEGQKGDLPALLMGSGAVLACAPGGRVGVLARGRPEASVRCADPRTLAAFVLVALGLLPVPAVPAPERTAAQYGTPDVMPLFAE
jgi:hypothetical protein